MVSAPPAGRAAAPDPAFEVVRKAEAPPASASPSDEQAEVGVGVPKREPEPGIAVADAAPPAPAPSAGGPASAEGGGAGTAPPPAEAVAGDIALLPHVRISRRGMYVDVDAYVCLAQGALELLATTPKGKTHEAVFAITALPRHMHAALLLLGLESGSPGAWGAGFGDGATGDRVRVFVTGFGEDPRAEVPVSEMVARRDTGDKLPENVFVFAGSLLSRPQEGGRLVYAADIAGDVISLVSFPDEVLALPTAASSSNEMLVWEVNGPAVPPVGTAVVLRIRPVKEKAGEGADARANGDEGEKEAESPAPAAGSSEEGTTAP